MQPEPGMIFAFNLADDLQTLWVPPGTIGLVLESATECGFAHARTDWLVAFYKRDFDPKYFLPDRRCIPKPLPAFILPDEMEYAWVGIRYMKDLRWPEAVLVVPVNRNTFQRFLDLEE